MSCKCPTCKLRITDENTHEINDPVKSMYEKHQSMLSMLIPIFTSELWTSFVLLI